MEKVILIRYGEIFLKGKNRGFFEKTLLTNIRTSLEKFNLEVNKVPGRFLVEKYDEDDEFEIIERLKKVAGIFSFFAVLKNFVFDKICFFWQKFEKTYLLTAVFVV